MQEEILSDRLFNKFSDFFFNKTGIRLKNYKKYLIINRLAKFVGADNEFKNYEDLYKALINGDSQESVYKFINAITTNFSFFFREKIHFDFLSHYFKNIYKDSNSIRIWSAACSTGQEAYSIAITACDCLPNTQINKLKILGTDISTNVLNTAIEGSYDYDKIEKQLDSRIIKNYFHKKDKFLIANDSLKSLINFRYLNLMSNYPFTKEFDIVFLRNVLIYFDNKEKEYIINKIYPYIKQGGYLIIGLSESTVGIKHNFKSLKYSIYKKE
ncbi:MAG: hypothetical protein A2086_03890 [Spirochaetes bacterium GWD1_27_9]|nr:MAG: hypothetical protein A2Z98_01475 [Spirochaetes bacterium GWB1_27_13]OHD24333.1 MAG: hypothetical protein A2Y34_05215 [Spirochaetes bacterium GWC1_27_15]OHD36154.1 MAG: hypothetical protein A2086_03890 [Spirochaetes bacterium GWD1_27_9]